LNDFLEPGLFFKLFDKYEHYKIPLCGCVIEYLLLGCWCYQVPAEISLYTIICYYFFLIFRFQVSLPCRRNMIIEFDDGEVMPKGN